MSECKENTATHFTSYCIVANQTVSSGQSNTITPMTTCTKTVSSVYSGCKVSATSTSIIEPSACPYLGPDVPTVNDGQGEDGAPPEASACPRANMTITPANETDSCPYLGPNAPRPLDPQGEDGSPELGGSCPLTNVTVSPNEDQVCMPLKYLLLTSGT